MGLKARGLVFQPIPQIGLVVAFVWTCTRFEDESGLGWLLVGAPWVLLTLLSSVVFWVWTLNDATSEKV